MYVYSPFVIALAPTFIDGFKYNFTQMLGMIISQSKFTFQGPGLKVKVTVVIFRKNFVIALALAFIDGF